MGKIFRGKPKDLFYKQQEQNSADLHTQKIVRKESNTKWFKRK